MEPKKTNFSKIFRKPFDKFASKLPMPKIDPNIVSVSTIATSLIAVGFLVNDHFGYFTLFLIITLILDWSDGLIARKHNIPHRNGFVYDAVSDRISELILFSFIYQFALVLVFINCFLTLNSFRTGKYWTIPLRQILLIVALVKFIM